MPASQRVVSIEYGRKNQTEERHADHAREHRSAQRLAQLGAGAYGPYERYDAQNERERRHEDGTHAQSRGLRRRIVAVAAVVLELVRELDNQNGVLGCEAD